MTTEGSRNALFTLIKEAKALEHLDMGSSNLDDEDETEHGMELIECLKESSCKGSLKVFAWSYDAFEMNDLIESMLEVIGDRDQFTNIERVELMETLEGSTRRNELRKQFAEKGIKLILSDR